MHHGKQSFHTSSSNSCDTFPLILQSIDVFSGCSLQPRTPETRVTKINFIYTHTLFIPVTRSHIILFVYLSSLCSTALCSCRTAPSGAEGFVCMEMSAAALWGVARRAELFDAGSSAEGREPPPPQRRGAQEEAEEAAGWCEEPGAALEKVKGHSDWLDHRGTRVFSSS